MRGMNEYEMIAKWAQKAIRPVVYSRKEPTMSADNGVYILESPLLCRTDFVAPRFEYRVAYAMAIDNIQYEPDIEGFNTEELKKYFGKCFIFQDRMKALVKADKIAQECEILEYGIQFISLPFVFPE